MLLILKDFRAIRGKALALLLRVKYFKNVYDRLKALETKTHELNVENIISVFVLRTLSFYHAGHF